MWRGKIHERRTWLLLDRLDEVPPNQIQWALHVIAGWKCRLVLASRPNALAVQRIPFRETIRTYEIYQFDRDAFLDKWYSGQQTKGVMVDLLNRNRSFAEYALNPLLLTLLCSVTDNLAFQSSLTRGELLDCIVKKCLGLLPRGRDNSSSDHRLDSHWGRSHQVYECFADLAWDILRKTTWFRESLQTSCWRLSKAATDCQPFRRRMEPVSRTRRNRLGP